jgi:hypothetical protein
MEAARRFIVAGASSVRGGSECSRFDFSVAHLWRIRGGLSLAAPRSVGGLRSSHFSPPSTLAQ